MKKILAVTAITLMIASPVLGAGSGVYGNATSFNTQTQEGGYFSYLSPQINAEGAIGEQSNYGEGEAEGNTTGISASDAQLQQQGAFILNGEVVMTQEGSGTARTVEKSYRPRPDGDNETSELRPPMTYIEDGEYEYDGNQSAAAGAVTLNDGQGTGSIGAQGFYSTGRNSAWVNKGGEVEQYQEVTFTGGYEDINNGPNGQTVVWGTRDVTVYNDIDIDPSRSSASHNGPGGGLEASSYVEYMQVGGSAVGVTQPGVLSGVSASYAEGQASASGDDKRRVDVNAGYNATQTNGYSAIVVSNDGRSFQSASGQTSTTMIQNATIDNNDK